MGEERAIVAAVAGTTRDVIEERFFIDGVPVRVLDTAGLRASDDEVERIGIERARRALAGAAVALVVVDGSRPLDADANAVLAQRANGRASCCSTKAISGASGYERASSRRSGRVCSAARSTRRRSSRVRRAVAQRRLGHASTSTWRARTSPRRAKPMRWRAPAKRCERPRATLDAGDALDLIAPELLAALAALGEITGAVATEAILDGIFARFCVGK